MARRTRAGLSEPRQRAVLGLLALNPDVPVHRETLIDTLWPTTASYRGTSAADVR